MDALAPVNTEGQGGLSSIASSHSPSGYESISAVSVVFAANARPAADAVRELAKKSGQFAISFEPAAVSVEESGWVELLSNGMTFDCMGLAPGPPAALPERVHNFGVTPEMDFGQSQAITLVPGPHLAGGGAMFPVVRCLAWLGALLADLEGAQAVCWHSARSYNAPQHFRTSVLRWIEGGAFPALGLTALVPTADGGLASEGLALFIGQEVHLAPDLAADRSEGAKLAVRLVNWLVENGRIDVPSQLAGPSGETLLLDPQQNPRIIKVSKSS